MDHLDIEIDPIIKAEADLAFESGLGAYPGPKNDSMFQIIREVYILGYAQAKGGVTFYVEKDSPCTHASRRGLHEWYMEPKGLFCRACGSYRR